MTTSPATWGVANNTMICVSWDMFMTSSLAQRQCCCLNSTHCFTSFFSASRCLLSNVTCAMFSAAELEKEVRGLQQTLAEQKQLDEQAQASALASQDSRNASWVCCACKALYVCSSCCARLEWPSLLLCHCTLWSAKSGQKPACWPHS